MSSGRFGVFAGSTPLALGLPKSAALERAADEARGHRVVYVYEEQANGPAKHVATWNAGSRTK